MDLKNIRSEYRFTSLDETDCPDNPNTLFQKWLNDWLANKPTNVDGTEFILSTTDSNMVSSRVMLMKGFDSKGLRFFTNYDSGKGEDIKKNTKAQILFFWQDMMRQVRISVSLERLSLAENEEYFQTRPLDSQISSIISSQSKKITKEELLKKHNELRMTVIDKKLECPPNWGGFLAIPLKFEFWQGQPSRLHDRIVYELINNNWERYRIAP